jgi:hypothetical protein
MCRDWFFVKKKIQKKKTTIFVENNKPQIALTKVGRFVTRDQSRIYLIKKINLKKKKGDLKKFNRNQKNHGLISDPQSNELPI